MNPSRVRRGNLQKLTDLPNIGPASAGDLSLVGINQPAQLQGRNPYEMYEQLCTIAAQRHDPCVIDVLISIARFMNGEELPSVEELPSWWKYTDERKLQVERRCFNHLKSGAHKHSGYSTGAFNLPASTENFIGKHAFETLDSSVFEPTTLPLHGQSQLRELFSSMLDGLDGTNSYQIQFRTSRQLGANALELPSGTVVVTDGLVYCRKVGIRGQLPRNVGNFTSPKPCSIIDVQVGFVKSRLEFWLDLGLLRPVQQGCVCF